MTFRAQPSDLIFWLVLLLPLSTQLPLATLNPGQAYVQTPMILVMTALLGILACWIGSQDAPLGWLAGWWVLQLLWHPTASAHESVEIFTLGLAMLMLMRHADQGKQRWWTLGLAALATVEIVLLLLQHGKIDPTWIGFDPDLSLAHPTGTFGNKSYLGAFLALVIPMAPLMMLPILIIGLIVAQAWLGFIAASIGLLVRFGVPWKWSAIALIASVTTALTLHPAAFWSFRDRADMWLTGLASLSWWEWIIGKGPGSWMETAWNLPLTRDTLAEGLPWVAHNEWVQVIYEEGLVAVGFLGWWIWRRCEMWRSPYAGSVAALAVLSLGFFPFHIPTTAILSMAVLGLATHNSSGSLS